MVDVRAVRDPLESGWQALDEGRWDLARHCFEESLSQEETPEALEGLGWAGYLLDDDPLTFDARERAYRLYLRRGDHASAARVAAWLAADCLEFRGEFAVANGWLQRAHRLLDGLEPGPDHGWLAVHEASMVMEDEPATAERLGAYAAELGRRFGVAELEMVGLGLEGRALVSEGKLVEGMRRLDGATAAALAGEARILVCVAWAACCLISACEKVRDYDRAGQWCGKVRTFCEREGIGLLLGVCRAKYAGVLTWEGKWSAAEAELRAAVDVLAPRPPMTSEALVRLGELRRRQGRLDEADELFSRCGGHVDALLGRALLALDRGQPEDAAGTIERFLRHYPASGRLERAAGLEVAVAANASLGRVERAREALDELRSIASLAATGPLQAAALAAEGALAAATGDHEGARRAFEDALDLFATSAAPFEKARLRLALAESLTVLDRPAAARQQAGRALTVLAGLGAGQEVRRAESALARLADGEPVGAGSTPDPLRRLSRREREVLALVARGLTNAEIAERLVLSEHTIHRHVANILRKLGLSSRVAAASLAGRHGLV